jgi:hypothetical protein
MRVTQAACIGKIADALRGARKPAARSAAWFPQTISGCTDAADPGPAGSS